MAHAASCLLRTLWAPCITEAQDLVPRSRTKPEEDTAVETMADHFLPESQHNSAATEGVAREGVQRAECSAEVSHNCNADLDRVTDAIQQAAAVELTRKQATDQLVDRQHEESGSAMPQGKQGSHDLLLLEGRHEVGMAALREQQIVAWAALQGFEMLLRQRISDEAISSRVQSYVRANGLIGVPPSETEHGEKGTDGHVAVASVETSGATGAAAVVEPGADATEEPKKAFAERSEAQRLITLGIQVEETWSRAQLEEQAGLEHEEMPGRFAVIREEESRWKQLLGAEVWNWTAVVEHQNTQSVQGTPQALRQGELKPPMDQDGPEVASLRAVGAEARVQAPRDESGSTPEAAAMPHTHAAISALVRDQVVQHHELLQAQFQTYRMLSETERRERHALQQREWDQQSRLSLALRDLQATEPVSRRDIRDAQHCGRRQILVHAHADVSLLEVLELEAVERQTLDKTQMDEGTKLKVMQTFEAAQILLEKHSIQAEDSPTAEAGTEKLAVAGALPPVLVTPTSADGHRSSIQFDPTQVCKEMQIGEEQRVAAAGSGPTAPTDDRCAAARAQTATPTSELKALREELLLLEAEAEEPGPCGAAHVPPAPPPPAAPLSRALGLSRPCPGQPLSSSSSGPRWGRPGVRHADCPSGGPPFRVRAEEFRPEPARRHEALRHGGLRRGPRDEDGLAARLGPGAQAARDRARAVRGGDGVAAGAPAQAAAAAVAPRPARPRGPAPRRRPRNAPFRVPPLREVPALIRPRTNRRCALTRVASVPPGTDPTLQFGRLPSGVPPSVYPLNKQSEPNPKGHRNPPPAKSHIFTASEVSCHLGRLQPLHLLRLVFACAWSKTLSCQLPSEKQIVRGRNWCGQISKPSLIPNISFNLTDTSQSLPGSSRNHPEPIRK